MQWFKTTAYNIGSLQIDGANRKIKGVVDKLTDMIQYA